MTVTESTDANPQASPSRHRSLDVAQDVRVAEPISEAL